MTAEVPSARPASRLGGAVWVVWATIAVAVIVLAATLGPVVARERHRPPGDGRDPASYGFALTSLRIPAERIVAAQRHRDMLPSLDHPSLMAGEEMVAHNERIRGKYVVSTDPVIGVVVNGAARAYPLSVMQVQEVANDELGGVPIVVTYSPLCGSVCVYERGVDGAEVDFGTSGLVVNSNPLLYDRRAEGDAESSLWSQLRGEAIAGPAAARGERLRRIPASLLRWSDWLAAHPDTTVPLPDPALAQHYKSADYAPYFATERFLFPVELPEAPSDGPAWKSQVVVLDPDTDPLVMPQEEIARRAAAHGTWIVEHGGRTVTFHHRRDHEAAWATEADGTPARALHCLRFAWEAR